ncbi:MAG: hypothetical protein V1818_01710 [Candidatus Aenigmatarchaeota archaeon]
MFDKKPSDEFKKVAGEIDKAIGENRRKGINYVEVTSYQWNVLLKNDDFEKQVNKRNANMGGYEIRKGIEFKVHLSY